MFCPRCGDHQFAARCTKRFSCDSCQFEFYQNVAAATAAMMVCNDELLVAIRGREPGKGLWDLPGGFSDPQESLERGLCRELKEELNLELDPNALQYFCSYPNIYPYNNVTYYTSDAFFLVELAQKPPLQADDDVADIIWVPLAELSAVNFAFSSMQQAIQRLLDDRQR
uniref:NUDIX hydrolase n=1 Tax=Thaumasiovibrio occultus TaxID=1891184 RepID=UPI000B357BEF|nr:NUDIX domain-containing protein [Thaumasiovibrio occultus]